MTPIQLILFLLLATLVIVYFARFRSRLLDRLAVLSIGSVGFAMVAKPDWTTGLAQFLGVGRGADLIMYLGFLGVAFTLILIYAELRALDARVANLTQFLAVTLAQNPAKHSSVPNTEVP